MLLFFLIVGLTYQLAQALAARRYLQKQDEFVANVTHETEVAAGGDQAAGPDAASPGRPELRERRRFLGYIEEQADRMASLVDDVLESSRLVAKKRSLELVPIDVGEFVERYARDVGPRARSHGVHLLVRRGHRCSVQATDEALRRVLDNLIDNAVRFSDRAARCACGRRERRLGGPPRGGGRRSRNSQEGTGADLRPLLSGGSSRAHARRHGSGWGLAIVAGLVEEMGARSRRSRARSEGVPVSWFGCRSRERGRGAPSSPPRVLVVEDEEAIAAGLRVLNLQRKGYEVEMAHDGDEALRRTPRPAASTWSFSTSACRRSSGFEVLQEDARLRRPDSGS